MFVILIIFSTIALASGLEPAENVEVANDKIKNIINKYLAKIPDIEEQYIVNEGLSAAISHFFKGKISSFPLYRISLKIDRNPVKIPWTLGDAKLEEAKITQNLDDKNKHVEKQYKYQKHVSSQDLRNIKMYGDPEVSKNQGNPKLSEESNKIKNLLPSETKIIKYRTSDKLNEQPDKTLNLDTSKLEPDILKNIEESDKSKKIESPEHFEQPDRSKIVEAVKMSVEPDKSTNIEAVKLSEEPDKNKAIEAS